MSKNINQVYIANPATSLQSTDLIYLGRSPYGITDDMACLFSTLLAAIPGATWTEVTAATQAMAANTGYIANRATLVTFTLPAASAVGTVLEVAGTGAGGFTLAQAAGQSINDGILSTTVGVGGSLSSTHRYNAIKMVCVVANTTWNVVSSQGNLTIV